MSSSLQVILALVAAFAALGLVCWTYTRRRLEVMRQQHLIDLDRMNRTLLDSVRENKDRVSALSRQKEELQRAMRALQQSRIETNEIQPLRDQIGRLKSHIAVLQAEIEHHREQMVSLQRQRQDEFADTQIDEDDDEFEKAA